MLALVIPSLVLAIATGIALSKSPNLYQSSARLIITLESRGVPDLSNRLNYLRQQVTSSETLEAVIRKHNPQEELLDGVISQMRRHIAVEADRSWDPPGAFAVSYRATDPEITRKVTDELAEQIVAQNSKEPSSSSSGSAVELLRKRADDITIQLREIEDRDPWLLKARSNFPNTSSQSGGSNLSRESIRAQQMTIESLKDQQYKIQQQLVDVERRISTQRQIVEQQKKGYRLRDNPTYAALIAKRTELQGQLDTLVNRQELTDKHPRVLAINDQIVAINRQIEELRNQDANLVSQSPEARELATLESESNRLRIDLEVVGRDFARRSAHQPLETVSPETSPVRRDRTALKPVEKYLGLKRDLIEVTKKLQDEEAKHERDGGTGTAQLRVSEWASLPERPIAYNRPLLISVAAVVGLALGAVFALFAEFRRRKSLQDGRDAEYCTRLTLLATIPRTTGVNERKRALWRAKARLVFAIAISVVATFALTKIFIASDIFALITFK